MGNLSVNCQEITNFTSQLSTICFKNTVKEKPLLLICKDVLCAVIKNSAVIIEKKNLGYYWTDSEPSYRALTVQAYT